MTAVGYRLTIILKPHAIRQVKKVHQILYLVSNLYFKMQWSWEEPWCNYWTHIKAITCLVSQERWKSGNCTHFFKGRWEASTNCQFNISKQHVITHKTLSFQLGRCRSCSSNAFEMVLWACRIWEGWMSHVMASEKKQRNLWLQRRLVLRIANTQAKQAYRQRSLQLKLENSKGRSWSSVRPCKISSGMDLDKWVQGSTSGSTMLNSIIILFLNFMSSRNDLSLSRKRFRNLRIGRCLKKRIG